MSMYDGTADERYREDPTFATLVDTLLSMIQRAQYTPSELRMACHLAACMYELTAIRPIIVSKRRDP